MFLEISVDSIRHCHALDKMGTGRARTGSTMTAARTCPLEYEDVLASKAARANGISLTLLETRFEPAKSSLGRCRKVENKDQTSLPRCSDYAFPPSLQQAVKAGSIGVKSERLRLQLTPSPF